MHPVKKRCLSERGADLRKGSSSMSEKQRSLMLDFLSEHPCMVLDRSVGGTANKPSVDELWENLAIILNNCGSGAQKDGCGWRRSWHDLKRYESLKAKESMTKLEKMTEKMNEKPTLVLSPLQERIANLLNVSISVSIKF
ncbi:hypothetical protein ONE63_001517 [Megalurothrips usitatus]|uniref:Regulatory protein zeste n=1 Tax=Megalurothrips usitatus TaxID=439358 RepID=A0AAV7XJ82_9NEOP|nr:hypothetical protein ONE63_001517 [Megalurothrips usitatus]